MNYAIYINNLWISSQYENKAYPQTKNINNTHVNKETNELYTFIAWLVNAV